VVRHGTFAFNVHTDAHSKGPL